MDLRGKVVASVDEHFDETHINFTDGTAMIVRKHYVKNGYGGENAEHRILLVPQGASDGN